MIKSYKAYKPKMSNKKVKFGSLDIIYGVFFLLIVGVLVSNFKLQQTIARADELLSNAQMAKEIVKVPVEVIKEEDRIIKLRAYLKTKNSPLAPYSEIIVSEADKYGIDYTKIVAISAIESEFGKRLPDGSHNAWGLGGSKFMYFPTWEEGIQYVSRLIGTSYKHNENAGIKIKYCPSSDGCNPNWAQVVTKTSNEILAWESKK